jgi:hypothetical protein
MELFSVRWLEASKRVDCPLILAVMYTSNAHTSYESSSPPNNVHICDLQSLVSYHIHA